MTGPRRITRCRLSGWLLALCASQLAPALASAQSAQLSFAEATQPPAPAQRPTGLLASWKYKGLDASEESEPGEPPAASVSTSSVIHAAPASSGPVSQGVVQASCSTCGSGRVGFDHLGGPGAPCAGCGHGPRPPCVPGQRPGCSERCGHEGCRIFGDHPIGRYLDCLYECVCCPDPCYDPRWCPIADAAFHVAAARPVAHQKIRWDSGLQVDVPDRAEFFWARQDGKGKGPRPATGQLVASRRVKYNDLTYYVEAGTGMVSAIVVTPYRSMDPDDYPHTAGFGDIKVGVKTLLFDCELIQIAFQMLTYTPSGSPGKGLGTGHVSLEPSLLLGLRIGPDTYLQHQLSEWIPLGGDPDYSGAVLHTHTSLNQVLLRLRPDVPIVGTLELNTWSFQDGAYTDPELGFQRAGGFTYASGGPGLRMFVCDKIDFGVHYSIAFRDPHFAAQLYVAEFRFRF